MLELPVVIVLETATFIMPASAAVRTTDCVVAVIFSTEVVTNVSAVSLQTNDCPEGREYGNAVASLVKVTVTVAFEPALR